jgi:dTDP-4-dehydrorhamnose 3,5-epimerase
MGIELPIKAVDPTEDWMTPGESDPPSVDSEWTQLEAPGINGVSLKEIRPVVTGDGCLTEIWRRDWNTDG